MSIFDSLKQAAISALKRESRKAVNKAVNTAVQNIGKGRNHTEKSFMKDRLNGKEYKVRSFFEGATPENDYTPNKPYVISVIENPYSFDNENWATLYVTSGGADNPRNIKLRKKPSTGEWFLNDIQCLGDIRLPKSEDKWA